MLPLIERAIDCSNQLIQLLQADELDVDAITALEIERRESIYQLFSQYAADQLTQESEALGVLQQLDRRVVDDVANKKKLLGRQLLLLKRGKASTAAYKLNKF